MATTRYVLYFNGLGSGKTRKREQFVFDRLAEQGIQVTHVHIDWRSDESFESLFDRTSRLVREQLREHGTLTLVGSSAGGSLAVNILGKVSDKNLSVITLCSRLHEARLPWWDHRDLEQMAYIGMPGMESRSFFDSVVYCGSVTVPSLTEAQKRQITTVQQWADFVVPRATMNIDGTDVYRVAALGHGWGIAKGALQLPTILTAMPR